MLTALAGARAADAFAREAEPLLRQYCLKCHDGEKKKGDVDLTAFTTTAAVQGDYKLWQTVLQQIEDEEMPPKDPQPTEAERERLVSAVRTALETIDWSKHRSAGRVTMPRLTKEEYGHTLRDLLGVDFRPGEFLLDDGQGPSGFNNDRDALFISPALTEQYFEAAERALDGLLGLHRDKVKRQYESEAMFMTERGSKPGALPGGGEGYALNRGQMTLYDSVTAPVDGWYRFTVKAAGVGGDSGARLRINDEPRGDIEVKQDEAKIHTLDVLLRKGTHQMAWNIELPRELKKIQKEQAEQSKKRAKPAPKTYKPLPANGGEIITPLAVKNAPVFPATEAEEAVAKGAIRNVNAALSSLQRPVEWLRLATPQANPSELSPFLRLLPDRMTSFEEAKAGLAEALGTKAEEIGKRIEEANVERLTDNRKIIAAAEAVIKSDGRIAKPNRKIGSTGIDWILVEGPVAPEGQGDLVFGAKDADAKEVLGRFLPRAFRRPVRDSEVERHLGIHEAALKRGETKEEALKLALAAALVSPNFLFRDELGGGQGEHALNDHQLASRLSYFLWLTMPDERLRKLANEGKLHEPEVLRSETKRLLGDARSRDFMAEFLGQWLGYAGVGASHIPDARKFRNFTPELSEAMKLEPVLAMEKLMREGGSLLELLDSRETFVNGELADHYGLAGVSGDEMRAVTFEDDKRGGLLGMAAVLTATSSPNRTSPVLRGKWVLETLLGRKLKEPPADAGQLDANAGEARGKTLREELAAHRRNEACAACHDKIDPLGFGLENFDAIGRYRESEAGRPVDASGELPGGETFNGAAGLRAYLVEHRQDEFLRHLIRRMLAFALGRELRFEDEAVVSELFKTVRAQDCRADVLVESIVLSLPFRHQDG